MKTNTMRRGYAYTANIPYPNAASRKQIVNRIVDLTLTFVLGAGAAAIVLFVLAVA
jgi:hypothetical protein